MDCWNITIKDETLADERRDLALFYNMNETLAYGLWDHWLVNQQGEWYDYGMDHVREFRFETPTQRYMAREIADLGNGWEITDTLWTDYDGGVGVSPASPYNDFTVTLDGQGQPVVQEEMRYLEGFGIPAQQTVATGETRYLHGDLIRSTMLIRDELGNNQATLAYTAFGEPVTADGQGGWRVGYPADDPGRRYQYAGGWGYETGGFGDDPALIALYGADPNLPPIMLLHVGARWYDPSLGRFAQRDPIGLDGGVNVYAYVDANPTSDVDPTGLTKGGKQHIRPSDLPWNWARMTREERIAWVLNAIKNAKSLRHKEALRAILKVARRGGVAGLLIGFCVEWAVEATIEVIEWQPQLPKDRFPRAGQWRPYLE